MSSRRHQHQRRPRAAQIYSFIEIFFSELRIPRNFRGPSSEHFLPFFDRRPLRDSTASTVKSGLAAFPSPRGENFFYFFRRRLSAAASARHLSAAIESREGRNQPPRGSRIPPVAYDRLTRSEQIIDAVDRLAGERSIILVSPWPSRAKALAVQMTRICRSRVHLGQPASEPRKMS